MNTKTGKIWGSVIFQRRLTWIETIILLALALTGYLTGLLEVPFHVDETFWMASSVRWDAWISGDLEHEVWTEGYDTYEVRPIPSYAVAVSQRAAGISPEENPLSFSESWEEYEQGADLRPADKILFYSRLPMVITAAVSIVLMSFFLARRVSRLAGYLFIILSFNAYFLLHLRRAMTESILVFFTVLILMATPQLLSAIRTKDTRGVVLWSALIGVLGGLAGQSKLTGLGCLVISLVPVSVVLLREKRRTGSLDKKHFTIITLGMPAVAFAVFVAVYPFFYTNTLERIFNTLVYRVGTTRAQMENFDWAVVSGGRLGFLFERVFIDLVPSGSRPLASVSLDQRIAWETDCFACSSQYPSILGFLSDTAPLRSGPGHANAADPTRLAAVLHLPCILRPGIRHNRAGGGLEKILP
jgi:hypothetical protein